MLDNLNVENILFLDIETAPAYANYTDLPEVFKKLWDKKAGQITRSEDETPEVLYPRAGIYAEYGKIICISVGVVRTTDGKQNLRMKSFCNDDEKVLLIDFSQMLNSHFNKPDLLLCAHNGKEFDFPFIIRRLLVNGLPIPRILDLAGKKPWEVPHIDTMELWKFGDYKSYTSLELLAALFNIPTPKDDINGSQIYDVYWNEKDLPRIQTYCQKDVITIVQIFLRYQGKQILAEDQIIYL